MASFKRELANRAVVALSHRTLTLRKKYAGMLDNLEEILRRAADAGEFTHMVSVESAEEREAVMDWACARQLESSWSPGGAGGISYVVIRWKS